MPKKKNPSAQPEAENDELLATAAENGGEAIPPMQDDLSGEDSVSAKIPDWVGSVVTADEHLPDIDDDDDDDDDEAEIPAPAPSPIAPRQDREHKSALSAASRARKKPKRDVSAEEPPMRRNTEKQTMSAIPVGPDTRAAIPIFEREAIQLKFEEDLTSRSDSGSIYATLRTYLSQGRILKGRIAGTSIYNGVPCWSIFMGPATIYIPFTESYMTIQKSMTGPLDPAKIKSQRGFLAQSIGLTAEFILTSLKKDPESPGYVIATASRTTALARNRGGYFTTDLLQPGTDIVCRIISVSNKEMFVTVAGLDVYIPRRNVTRRYIKNLSDVYHVDDTITMRILEVDPGSLNTLPSLTLSAIPLEEERLAKNRHRLKPGDRCHGIVSWVDDGKKDPTTAGRINLWLPDYEYYATSTLNLESSEKPIAPGTHVFYEHSGFTSKTFSHGKILRIIKR